MYVGKGIFLQYLHLDRMPQVTDELPKKRRNHSKLLVHSLGRRRKP